MGGELVKTESADRTYSKYLQTRASCTAMFLPCSWWKVGPRYLRDPWDHTTCRTLSRCIAVPGGDSLLTPKNASFSSLPSYSQSLHCKMLGISYPGITGC